MQQQNLVFTIKTAIRLFKNGVVQQAQLLIDTEVLADSFFAPGWPVHQPWHFHTLLVGGIAGMTFGAIVYGIKPFRHGCRGVNIFVGVFVCADAVFNDFILSCRRLVACFD
jgi:hypothetical protein